MDNNIEYIDDLIGKYLAGEASAEERVWIEAWAKKSEENGKYLDQFKTIFNKAATLKEWQHFNTDAAWTKVKGDLKKPAGKSATLLPKPDNLRFFWRIAASIIIVFGAGFFLYKMLTPGKQIINPVEVIAKEKSVADTLPDGSDVFLNKETKLAYTYNKADKLHKVKLNGEAYFNVRHEADEKFIIEAEGIYIRDIGTSFNVKAYPELNVVEVLVEEGEVEFYTDDNPGIHLHAGGKGIYNKTTKSFTIEQPEANVLAYKTKFFIFSGTDLKTVVETLNSVYDEKIVLSNNLQHCKLTVSFKNEDIHEIAEVIAETLSLEMKPSGNKIILEGKGCEN